MVTAGAVRLVTGLFGGDLGDGGAGGALVDHALAVGEGGDQGLDGEVVDRAGDAAAGLVHQAEGVVAEQGVAAAGELEVVLDVGHGLREVHAVQVEPQGHALVEGGQGADLQPPPQGGLAQQQAGERGVGVHVVVGEHADLLQLLGGQQVGLVDDHHAGLGLLGLLGGQQLGGLGDQAGLVEAGVAAEVADDLGVEAALADAGVGDVDDGVAYGVEGGDGGAGGDGLAGADLAGDHADGAFADQPGDAGDGFGVAAVGVQHRGGQVAAEGGAAEAVVGAQPLDHSSSSRVASMMISGGRFGSVSAGWMLVTGGVVGPSAAWSPTGCGVIVVAGCNPTSAWASWVASPVLGSPVAA